MNEVFSVVLFILAAFFLIVEFFQITRDWKNYLKFTNLFDLAPNILLVMNCYRSVLSFDGRSEDFFFW